MVDLSERSLSCTRHYYLEWYDRFKRAHGRLPPPYWTGPPVPHYNATHDEIVAANRLKRAEAAKA